MASDPFQPHPPAEDLASSTALPSVAPDALEHAAKHAAELVEQAAQAPKAPGARRSRKAETLSVVTEAMAAAPPALATSLAAPEAGLKADAGSNAVELRATEAQAPVAETPADTGDVGPSAKPGRSDAAEVLARLNAKAFEAMRTNIDLGLGFWTSLMGARSLPEAMALNAQHLRKQLEVLSAQGRELTGLAHQLAMQSFEQLRLGPRRMF